MHKTFRLKHAKCTIFPKEMNKAVWSYCNHVLNRAERSTKTTAYHYIPSWRTRSLRYLLHSWPSCRSVPPPQSPPQCRPSPSPLQGSRSPPCPRCPRCPPTRCSPTTPPGWRPPPGHRNWTFHLTSQRTWRSSRLSLKCSSRRGSSSATPRETSGWRLENSMATTSARRRYRDLKLSISHSRTCASWSLSFRSGWRTRRCLRTLTPRCWTRRPLCLPPRRRCPGGGRRGRPSTTRWGSPWREPSTPTQSPPARRCSTSLTASAWRRRWCGSGSVTDVRRRKGWILIAVTVPAVLPYQAWTPRPRHQTPWPPPHLCHWHQLVTTLTTPCPLICTLLVMDLSEIFVTVFYWIISIVDLIYFYTFRTILLIL